MLLLGVRGFQEGLTPAFRGVRLAQAKQFKRTYFPDNRESRTEVIKASKNLRFLLLRCFKN